MMMMTRTTATTTIAQPSVTGSFRNINCNSKQQQSAALVVVPQSSVVVEQRRRARERVWSCCRRFHRSQVCGRARKGGEYEEYLQKRDAELQRREQELWDRQMDVASQAARDAKELYTTVYDAYESLQMQYREERGLWENREEKLVNENEQLRNKLLYALTALAELQQGAGSQKGEWIDGTAASGGIPSDVGASGGAVGKRGGKNKSGGSSVAAEIAAAFEAVEQGDILEDDYSMFTSRLEGVRGEVIGKDNDTVPKGGVLEEEQGDEEKNSEQQGEESGRGAQMRGPPPTLTEGEDDIFWVNQLHVALVDAGYYPGDGDIEDFIFGESTQSAVLTFQACNGLAETGVVDTQTWRELLGKDLEIKESRDLSQDMMMMEEVADGGKENKPFAQFFSSESVTVNTARIDNGKVSSEFVQQEHVHEEKVFADGHTEVSDFDASVSGETSVRTEWPVLLEGDGGKEVHALHVLLENAGYWPGEDDTMWWQFGDSTVNALKTYQACTGLPESGACDEMTWKSLLGPGAEPCDLDAVQGSNSAEEDLADDNGGNRVWLIGEQRWEDRSKL